MSDIDAVLMVAVAPLLIRAAMFEAASLPMIPDGMPVRGGEGVINVPFGDVRGCEIW